MLLDPEFILIVAIVGAVGAIAGAHALEGGRRYGPEITGHDLLPMFPWEGPPLPRFFKTKPELLEELRGRKV